MRSTMKQATFVVLQLVTSWSVVFHCTQDAARADILVSTFDLTGMAPSGILRFDEQTGTQFTIGDVPPMAAPGLGPTSGATDVGVGPNGNIFVADGGSILHFEGTTGAPLDEQGHPGDGLFVSVPVAAQGEGFRSVLVDDTGQRLYAVDNTGTSDVVRVYEGPLSANPGTEILVNGGPLLATPSTTPTTLSAMAFAPDGRLLVSDLDGRKVFAVDLTTGADSVFIDNFATPFSGPNGIAVDENDTIYVVDLYVGAIYMFDSDGTNQQLFADIPKDPTTEPDGSFPSDITFDANGDLLVAALGGVQFGETKGRVIRIDPSNPLAQVTLAENLPLAGGIALIDDLLPGDYDGNGIVEPGDYQVWKSQLGMAVGPSTGADGNGDGVVNLADYTIWRDTLGATGFDTVSELRANRIPEPATSVLIVAAMGALKIGFSRRIIR